MREDTKNLIYMTLDLLESINKTSIQKNSFVNVDKTEIDQIKNELFNLMNNSDKEDTTSDGKKKKLIGTLPYVLMDTTKFPSNKSIAKLAEVSLNYKISLPEKRGRAEMIGMIIGKIVNDKNEKFNTFMEVWKDFINLEDSNQNLKTNEDFVDIWLDFFKKSQRNK
jgi:hypothetical protein